MSRVATAIDCSEKDRKELERLSNSRTDEARRVERAKIIIGCLAGRRNDEVAAEFGVQAATVGTWRRRFASEGLAGLRDRPRSGKPAVSPAELRQRLLKQLETPPPAGLAGTAGHWRKRSACRMMRFGVSCARKASNFGGIVRGA